MRADAHNKLNAVALGAVLALGAADAAAAAAFSRFALAAASSLARLASSRSRLAVLRQLVCSDAARTHTPSDAASIPVLVVTIARPAAESSDLTALTFIVAAVVVVVVARLLVALLVLGLIAHVQAAAPRLLLLLGLLTTRRVVGVATASVAAVALLVQRLGLRLVAARRLHARALEDGGAL
eukprot:7381067-Prymnesium_polylepis.3